MKERCSNKNNPSFRHYGKRGIRCKWNSFEEFYRDMGKSYQDLTKKHGKIELERIDNDGDYCKKNCRWTTHLEQMRNTRSNVFIKWEGEKLTLSELSRMLGISYNSLYSRLNKLKWSTESAFKDPIRKYTNTKRKYASKNR